MCRHGSYGLKVSVLGSSFCNTLHISMEFFSACTCVPFIRKPSSRPLICRVLILANILALSWSSLDVLPNTSHGALCPGLCRAIWLGNKSWAVNFYCTSARHPLVCARTPRCIPFFKAAALLHASNIAAAQSAGHKREAVFPEVFHRRATLLQLYHPETCHFHRRKVSIRFLCCTGGKTKGVIYYYVRIVYT